MTVSLRVINFSIFYDAYGHTHDPLPGHLIKYDSIDFQGVRASTGELANSTSQKHVMAT